MSVNFVCLISIKRGAQIEKIGLSEILENFEFASLKREYFADGANANSGDPFLMFANETERTEMFERQLKGI